MPATSIQEYTLQWIRFDAGEDILNKLILFCESRNCTLFVTSAGGSTWQMSMYHGNDFMLYQGRYEITTFSGFVYPPDTDGNFPTEWNLSMSVTHPDGSMIGGEVVGSVSTASEGHIVVCLIPQHIPIDRPTQMITRALQEAPDNGMSPQQLDQLYEAIFLAETCTSRHF